MSCVWVLCVCFCPQLFCVFVVCQLTLLKNERKHILVTFQNHIKTSHLAAIMRLPLTMLFLACFWTSLWSEWLWIQMRLAKSFPIFSGRPAASWNAWTWTAFIDKRNLISSDSEKCLNHKPSNKIRQGDILNAQDLKHSSLHNVFLLSSPSAFLHFKKCCCCIISDEHHKPQLQ